MIERKKRLLGLALGVLVVWPAVHVGLVAALDLDPARFCGFADYAKPPSYQWVLLIELRGEREVHMHNSWFSTPTRQIYRDFRKRRTALGRPVAPHDLAEAILAERPEMEGLKIVVMRDEISAATSRSVARPATAYLYRR